MSPTKTVMSQEACEASSAIAHQLVENVGVWLSLCDRINQANLNFVVTIGRGSSDHACTYAKYLFETKLGLITSTAAPSAITMYDADLGFGKALVIGISPSGGNPDICKIMEVARHKGAITVAMVNLVDSPLADIAEFVVPLWAGKEKAGAVTKSYIASLAALTHFVSLMKGDQNLQESLKKLPGVLSQATTLEWPTFIDNFRDIDSTLVISRGYGFPVAQEIALKFIEVASLQAEAFSAAELLHGPVALIKSGYPYLLLAQSDNTLLEILALALRVKNLGGKPLLVLPSNLVYDDVLRQHTSSFLTLPPSLGAVFDPIVAVQMLYVMIAELAVARGKDPDVPNDM